MEIYDKKMLSSKTIEELRIILEKEKTIFLKSDDKEELIKLILKNNNFIETIKEDSYLRELEIENKKLEQKAKELEDSIKIIANKRVEEEKNFNEQLKTKRYMENSLQSEAIINEDYVDDHIEDSFNEEQNFELKNDNLEANINQNNDQRNFDNYDGFNSYDENNIKKEQQVFMMNPSNRNEAFVEEINNNMLKVNFRNDTNYLEQKNKEFNLENDEETTEIQISDSYYFQKNNQKKFQQRNQQRNQQKNFQQNEFSNELLEPVINSEEENFKDNKKETINNKPNTIGVIGAILNIIANSLSLVYLIFLMVLSIIAAVPITSIIIIVFIILIPFITFVSNIRFLKGKSNKIFPGIMGLITFSILGGILVLVSDKKN